MKSMVSRLGALVLMLCAAVPALAAPPVFTTIAADSFAYAGNVALTGLNGGTGWTSAWQSDSIAFSDFRTNATGLSYPGLATDGGRIDWFAGAALNDAVRTLPLTNSGVVYIQFLAQFGAQSGGGTPNFRLSNGPTLTGAIGGNGGCPGTVYSILDNGLNPLGGGASCSTAPLGTLSLVLVQIDYDSPRTRMWINPNLASFDYFNPPAPQAQYAGLAPAFDRIAIYSRSPANIDELSVFRVSAPGAPQSIPGLSWHGVVLLAAALALAARGAKAAR